MDPSVCRPRRLPSRDKVSAPQPCATCATETHSQLFFLTGEKCHPTKPIRKNRCCVFFSGSMAPLVLTGRVATTGLSLFSWVAGCVFFGPTKTVLTTDPKVRKASKRIMYHLFASLGFGSNHDGANLFDASTFIGHLYRQEPQVFCFFFPFFSGKEGEKVDLFLRRKKAGRKSGFNPYFFSIFITPSEMMGK